MPLFAAHRPSSYRDFLKSGRPDARADIKGSAEYPDIRGHADFFQTREGTLVRVEVTGLPSSHGACAGGVFGFHIHEGPSCTGNSDDPFAGAGGHYNPGGCAHPYHAGDLPPLFDAGGRAFQAFLTNRFTAKEVIGRTIIIHGSPDDFTTQPSGNSGRKIACGVIRR